MTRPITPQLKYARDAQAVAAPVLVGRLYILALWEGVCRQAHIPTYLFPTPSEIAIRFVQQWPVLLHALSATLIVFSQAFLISVVLGTLIAFVFVQSRIVEMLSVPLCRLRCR